MQRSNYLCRSVLFLALAGISGSALAADADRAAPDTRTFIEKAAVNGMAEVEAGKIALSKSQHPEIRSFAERMVKDHMLANTELSGIAASKGIETPTTLDAEHQAQLDQLASKSGAEFDRAYSRHMNMDHSKAIALFEGASRSTDGAVAGFAKKTLPKLKEHKKLAEKLPEG